MNARANVNVKWKRRFYIAAFNVHVIVNVARVAIGLD